MLGKGQSGGFPVEVSGEHEQSPSSGFVDSSSKKGLHINCQLTGNVAPATPQQSQVLLTPASLQLAQLQAHLTLQRLKLAQGGSPASAAVLNQVLSNVAMSQPLLSHLRASAMVANPQGTFTPGVLGFPASTSSFSALASGVFTQSSNCLQPTQPMRGAAVTQQTADYGKKAAYPSDTDRRAPYNLPGGTSGASTADRQYSLINTQVKNFSPFQRDLYGQDTQGQPTEFSLHEQSAYSSTVKGDPWKSTVNATGNSEVSNNGPLRTASGQVLRSKTDLYNPEEPTADLKYNLSGMQRFGGYPTLHGSEDLKTLQPHQVNDYYAATPSQLPHQCSICDKKVYNLKDWEQHVKGKLHLQNKTQYTSEGSAVASTGAVHYVVGRPSDAPLSSGQTNSMVFTTTGQDVSSGGITSFLPAAAMKTYPASDTTLTSLHLDPKSFPPRKGTVGRVVHICNLPEGSCTENDVINLGLPFGKVTNYILMRSTHQAFLEMAYVEAAQAMVQYHQLSPAMINNQKLLIRMSKRYKELQLKKPGKDVETIIQDITSQRGRDGAQEQDHYMPERARSRSPIGRSLSPGFTCDAPEGPQGTLCRGAERGTNGLVSHRSTWEWSSLTRRDEREGPWQNGESMEDERPNGWGPDRRKTYHKLTEHMNMRCAEERGGSREWPPQRMSYRNVEDSYYTKGPNYKLDKPPRPLYQRHDKSKRRDVDHHRSRHSDPDTSAESSRAEDKRSSPERGRSKKSSRKHSSVERHSKEHNNEQTEQQAKEKSATPQRSSSPKDSNNCEKIQCREVENAEDTDDEGWYPKNMEELVTVDEVGGEDDIIEPDLPDLEECAGTQHKQPAETEENDNVSAALQVSDMKETQVEEKSIGETKPEGLERNDSAACPQELKLNTPSMKGLDNFPHEFKALIEETCSDDNDRRNGVLQKPVENDAATTEEDKSQGTETTLNGARSPQDIEALSSSCDQDRAVSEHSIPLGVEFIVPQTGFYCKLCGLFYSSEETAKATHCRSVVHYRNLQKYLSHLAEESLLGTFSNSSLQE